MELTSYAASPLSLLAPIIAIGLAILTRRVMLSLGLGIVSGALLLNDFSPLVTLHYLWQQLVAVFIEMPDSGQLADASLNSWNVYILLFLLALGAMVGVITLAGGTRAFGNWARARVTTRRGSQLMTVLLGVFIFIDDYFNSLAVGNICRPLTDRQGLSRARLAYLIDSTAAPVCVLTPISSWGAYIISLIAGILATHQITDVSPFGAFLELSALNYYAIAALVLVIASAWFDINFGAMRRHAIAARDGELFDAKRGNPPGNTHVEESERGRPMDLLIPIIVLVIATFFMIVQTGASALAAEGEAFGLIRAFELTDVAKSLIIGGAIGLLAAVVMLLRHRMGAGRSLSAIAQGASSMLPAVYILVFAWLLTGIIGSLGTGQYLATLVEGVVSPTWLPMLLFVLSGLMAFATGTSWGTFGIMLPIAGDMAAATELAMMLPMMGAVLAGSVFGDHCSPISDTTILSSTGASCHHIDHVMTQLPYALLGAGVSLIAYLVMGLTDSTLFGWLSLAGLLVISIAWLARREMANPVVARA
ncbi:Na+/H+ antiporter NhaC family protein [Cobetia amphilecti]|uniref:Na+/H+ antiporter NhaC family protein n=1 Tax=Cobetia amphilecti TaxID=1055104 RepID=UPI0026E14E8C|nr:Na+/H+ antiporter NhaC family protein [Cobetia amphilecti]MDO6814475.1 Na+/H+ antiporter NhaC family protein [Cobetia amphilecti]